MSSVSEPVGLLMRHAITHSQLGWFRVGGLIGLGIKHEQQAVGRCADFCFPLCDWFE